MRSMRVCARAAFTLVELLVVVGIIAVLVSMLLPALASAQRRARSAACLNQMRQIGVATLLYAQDNNGYLPRSSHSALAYGVRTWSYLLPPYLGYPHYAAPPVPDWWETLFNGVYRCPEDPRSATNRWSYGKNVWFELSRSETGEIEGTDPGPTFWKVAQAPRSSAAVLYGELASGSMADHIMAHFWYSGGSPEVDRTRHRSWSNYAFLDGHAESLTFTQTFDPPRVDRWHPGRAR